MEESIRGLSVQAKVDLWQRWRVGQSLSDIGRALGKAPASVFAIIAARGGIGPPVRSRNAKVLTAAEREEISRGLSAGMSLRGIATGIGRPASTVSREVQRNGGRSRYRAGNADAQAWSRALRPKACKLAGNQRLQRVVALKLKQDWSPQQIAGWLKERFGSNDTMKISHETTIEVSSSKLVESSEKSSKHT